MTLEGPTLRLEPLTRAHLPALSEIAFEPALWRYTTMVVQTPAQLTQWLEDALVRPHSIPWATILKQDNRLIGSTRFLDLDLTNRTVEIGSTFLHPTWQRTGLNREAKLLQLTHAFETMKLNRVAFKTHHENLQSQAAIRALGAQYEGTFRNHMIQPDGTLRHSVWFSITKEDWPEVKSRFGKQTRTT